MKKPTVIVICGPTASGKTALSINRKNLIANAGVANRILLASEKYNTAQEILDALIKIEDYHPDCLKCSSCKSRIKKIPKSFE